MLPRWLNVPTEYELTGGIK